MKYVIINPDTGEHIASISKDALQLASVLMNEHLYDMLRDHSEQRLIDHVSHSNKELQSVIAAMSRDEFNNMSLQQLHADQRVYDEDGTINKLEIVPNDTFEPNERVCLLRYDIKLFLRAFRLYIDKLNRIASKTGEPVHPDAETLKQHSIIFAHYMERMPYRYG